MFVLLRAPRIIIAFFGIVVLVIVGDRSSPRVDHSGVGIRLLFALSGCDRIIHTVKLQKILECMGDVKWSVPFLRFSHRRVMIILFMQASSGERDEQSAIDLLTAVARQALIL